MRTLLPACALTREVIWLFFDSPRKMMSDLARPEGVAASTMLTCLLPTFLLPAMDLSSEASALSLTTVIMKGLPSSSCGQEVFLANWRR